MVQAVARTVAVMSFGAFVASFEPFPARAVAAIAFRSVLVLLACANGVVALKVTLYCVPVDGPPEARLVALFPPVSVVVALVNVAYPNTAQFWIVMCVL